MVYDLIIIGGGPAGIAAGVYASRKQLKTNLITKEWGGQSTVSETIYNWIGTPEISGANLAKSLKEHITFTKENTVTITNGAVVSLQRGEVTHAVVLENGEHIEAKAILIATGSHHRTLDIPGAKEFEHKGLTYCASCDGPLFAGVDVAIVGGGNAAFEAAAQLLAYCKSVTLLNRSENLRADPITVKNVLAHPNMKMILNAVPVEIVGNTFVDRIRYQDKISGETRTLTVGGIFVEIGVVPNTEMVKEVVACDESGRVKIDPWTGKTSTPGIWAAGDCTNILYHQNNISAGEGVKALEDIYITLKTKDHL